MQERREGVAAAALAALLFAGCAETEAEEPSPAGDHAASTGGCGTDCEPWRAVWVTRFDFRTRDDVEVVIARCVEAGFNRVLFQVRGNATAFYRSGIEPWADELGGADPGFDPLAVAVAAAHARGVELHAWVNVMPAWWGTDPPQSPAQLWNAQPDWAWFDQEGRRAPLLDRFYASVNPCLPEVRAYLADVLREIVAGYEIDGLHLDYVRFPNEPPVPGESEGIDYPRDERTLALYRDATGLAPDDDRARWTDWRCACVTDVVRAARALVDELRPGAWLTAAVGAAPAHARATYYQDAVAWLREGLLDAAIPMNYTQSVPEFEARLALWGQVDHADLEGRAPVVMGLSAEGDDPRLRREQLAHARAELGGFAVFAYASLFESPNEATADTSAAGPALRAARREALLPLLAELAAWDRAGG